MPASMLLLRIKRLEAELARCRAPHPSVNLVRTATNANRSGVAIHIPATADEALADLKAEIKKSSCKDSVDINDKLAFLTSKITGGGKKRHTRKHLSKKRKSKKTRKY